MSKVLFNPTNETLEAYHNGLPVTLPPGQKVKIDSDAKANHVINSLGQRGLCLLEYGDEPKEESIAEAGRKRNIEFKTKQVIRMNQDNETRQQTHKPYIDPTDQIKAYAEELGITLLSPFATTDAKNSKIKELTERLDARDQQFNELMRQMAELMKEKTGVAPETEEELRVKELTMEFQMMKTPEFKQYAEANKDRVSGWPLIVQEAFAAKWNKFFPEEPRPE